MPEQNTTEQDPLIERDLKRGLKLARKAFAQSKGEATREVYQKALQKYADYLFTHRGELAAQLLYDREKLKILWDRHGTVVKVLGAGALLAAAVGVGSAAAAAGGFLTLGSMVGTVAGNWLLLNGGNVVLGAGLGIGLNLGTQALWNRRFARSYGAQLGAMQNAAAVARSAGAGFDAFRASKDGSFVRRQASSVRWGKGIGRVLGLALGVGTYYELGHGTGQELAERFGFEHFFAKLFGYDVAALKAEMVVNATQIGTAFARPFEAAAQFAPNLGIVAYAAERIKSITDLGTDPFATSPEQAFSNESIERAAKMLGDERNWPQAKRDAFITYCKANRTFLIEAFKTGKGTVLLPEGTPINAMVNGPLNGGYDTGGPATLDIKGGTRVLPIVFEYTDESGVRHRAVVYAPTKCFNFSDASDEILSSPVAEKPKVTAGWSYESMKTKGINFCSEVDACSGKKIVSVLDVPTFTAPKGMETIEQAYAEFKIIVEQLAHEGKIKPGMHYQFIALDTNGDGHPDRLYCVTYKVEQLPSGEIKITYQDTKLKEVVIDKRDAIGRYEGSEPYGEATEAEQKRWLAE